VTAATHPLYGQGGNLRRRRRVNRIVEIASTVAAILAVAVLAIVVGSVAVKGLGAINLDFLTKAGATTNFSATAAGTGIANGIVGTAILVGLATLMAVPLGLLVAIYTHEFAPARVGYVVRFALDVLNGVPTIITGIFIYGVLVVGGQQSGWAGAIALAIVMLPIVARTAQEVLSLVPEHLREAAYALGVTRWKTVVRVIIPTAAGGLLTGALLGVARVAGETAPLLFVCSIFQDTAGGPIQTDPSQALASIPVTIFQLSEKPTPIAHTQAWGAALLLILFVLALNVVARAFYARSQRRLKG
jgi:phosphate transport system permease protein